MKNSTRRNFTRHLFMGLAAAPIMAPAVKVFAQEVIEEGDEVPVSGIEIRNPHGHILELAISDLLKLSLGTEETLSFSIQGKSRHPHTLTLTKENLIELSEKSEIVVETTIDRGHSHSIKITLGQIVS